jgi:Domain of unknown function (DUF4397)
VFRTSATSATSVRRRLTTLAVATLVAAGLSALDPAPASAASVGYVRLAHLSPDTPEVDVYLSSASGGMAPKKFPGVGYGVVSDYLTLDTGTYAVAMRGAGAPESSAPVLSTQVTVDAGKAYTVAGVGKHADLGLRVIQDDLSLPDGGKAKVRIVQASVQAPVLDVSVASGSTIADGVQFASTTGYREVNQGSWTVNLQQAGGGRTSTVKCSLTGGNVYSLIVLDRPSGLTAELRTDAQRTGGMPQGGVETGDGGSQRSDPVPALLMVALLALVGAGFVVSRVRAPRGLRP